MNEASKKLEFARAQTSAYGLDIAHEQIKPPSKIRYGFALIWAIVGDIIDFPETAADATIIGSLLTALADFVAFDVPIIMLIGNKGMREKTSQTEKMLTMKDNIEKTINRYRKKYARFLRFARKSKLLRRPVTKLALKFKAFRKVAAKKIEKRLLGRIILEKLPLFKWWPFRTLGVWKAYKQERQMYEMALEARTELLEAQDALSALASSIQTINEHPNGAQQTQTNNTRLERARASSVLVRPRIPQSSNIKIK